MTLAYLWVISEPGAEVTVEEFNGKAQFFLEKIDRNRFNKTVFLDRLVR